MTPSPPTRYRLLMPVLGVEVGTGKILQREASSSLLSSTEKAPHSAVECELKTAAGLAAAWHNLHTLSPSEVGWRW